MPGMTDDAPAVPRPRSAPGLLAIAEGRPLPADAPHACWYCGERCGEEHPASAHVKASFTGRDGVVAPGSSFVCVGCTLSLREGADIAMVDGESRAGQKVRCYSWVLTRHQALAATKAHVGPLRTLCLGPPPPPWAISLSDSGQKHLLYRGVVNHGITPPFVVTLEGERVEYDPRDLASRLALCGKLIAATGKPALGGPPTVRFAVAVTARYPESGGPLVEVWQACRVSPLSRLALWLCGPKEECERNHPPEEH